MNARDNQPKIFDAIKPYIIQVDASSAAFALTVSDPSMKIELANLDYLRACAVLFVVFDHIMKLAFHIYSLGFVSMDWLGRLGVLFFFVHTSCVLMMSLERQSLDQQPGGSFFGRFYLRRIFRIYPLSTVAIGVAMVTGIASLSRGAWAANFALVQNLTGSPNAFEALWSLPVEVQMYLVLPFCFLVATRFRSLVAPMSLWALAVGLALAQPHISWRLRMLLYAPCFVPGVLAYVLFRRKLNWLPAILWPPSLFVIAGAFLFRPNWGWSAWLACLTLGLVAPTFRPLPPSFLTVAVAYIAKYSYGIYLSHTLLLVWMKPTVRTLPLFFIALAAASVLSFHLVEQPLIRAGQRLTRKRAVPLEMEPAAP